MIALITALACSSTPSPDDPTTDPPVAPVAPTADSASPVPAVPTATALATGSTGDSADPVVPMIDEALAGRCVPSFDAAPPEATLHRVTLPGARCNDGTPAVMFVAPGAASTDWVVYFDGGSRCADGEGCAARWCAEDAYDATKMSSRWAPEARGVDGLLGGAAANPFRTWNRAFVTYCSSDFWVGQRSDVVLTTDDGVPYRVHFEGARVVDEALAWLRAGGTSDDGLATVPALAGADRLLLAGSSAGAMAVTQHADAIAATLPGVAVVAALDALSTPDPAEMHAEGLEALWAAELDRQYTQEVVPLYDARLHAGCLAAQGAEVARCWEPSFVHANAMALPRLVHHDLRDRVLSDSYRALGATLPGYMNGSKVLLEGLAGLDDVSVHGPSCGTHTTLSSDAVWFGQTVDGVSMANALAGLVAGEGVVAIDPGPGTASDCR